jgi:hypothetical protein
MAIDSPPRPPETVADAEPNVIKKFSFNLYQSDIKMLKELAQWAGTNVTQALRSAIATEHFLRRAHRNGESIYLVDRNGERREIVFR